MQRGYCITPVCTYIHLSIHMSHPNLCTSHPYVQKMVSIPHLLKRLVSVLDSYFIHWYMIIKYTSSWLPHYCGSYGPFSTSKNDFHLISSEMISILDSYFFYTGIKS